MVRMTREIFGGIILEISLVTSCNIHVGIIFSAHTHDFRRDHSNSLVINGDTDKLRTQSPSNKLCWAMK